MKCWLGENIMNKNDLRYRKCHELIHKTFDGLLKENEFATISVKDIVKEAGINRSTFYAHFEDKYALLNEYEDNLVLKMIEVNSKSPIAQVVFNPNQKSADEINTLVREYFFEIAGFFRQNGDAIYILANEKSSGFMNKIAATIQNKWCELGLENGLIIPQNYAITIFTAIIVAVLTEWIKSGFKESDEKFADILTQSMACFPKGLFGKC